MKIDLDQITMGISPATDEVFVGITKKNNSNEWLHKKNLTNDFIYCALQRWNGYKEIITSSNGKRYEVVIKEIQ